MTTFPTVYESQVYGLISGRLALYFFCFNLFSEPQYPDCQVPSLPTLDDKVAASHLHSVCFLIYLYCRHILSSEISSFVQGEAVS